MLDFFSILSKGGLVLWYFQADLLKLDFQAAVNEMIKYALIDVGLANRKTKLAKHSFQEKLRYVSLQQACSAERARQRVRLGFYRGLPEFSTTDVY